MFTLEIDGRAIAITDADEAQARELFESQDFKDDLLSLESEGRPIWNGSSALRIRGASEEEVDAFDEAMDEEYEDDAESAGEDDDDEDGVNVLFLVPVDAVDEADDAPTSPPAA